jgi:hypothetical protein
MPIREDLRKLPVKLEEINEAKSMLCTQGMGTMEALPKMLFES